MRRNWKLFLSVLMALAILISMTVPAMAEEAEIQVPVSVVLTESAAGVELCIQLDEGLEFDDWVLPEALQRKLSVQPPPSDRKADDTVTLGAYNRDNVIEPNADGSPVDLGYLVFTGTGSTPEILTADCLHVADKDTIDTVIYNMPVTQTISLTAATAQDSAVTVSLRGDSKVSASAGSVTYTVYVNGADELATVGFTVEIDAANVDEPYAKGRNGFSIYSQEFEKSGGKWVGKITAGCIKGLTANGEAEIIRITADTKGTTGTVSAELKDMEMCRYVGNKEAWVRFTYAAASCTTAIGDTAPEPETPTEPDNPGTDDKGDSKGDDSGSTDDQSSQGADSSNVSINGVGTSTSNTFPFTDVRTSDWYYSSVQNAWQNGLIDGVTATRFMPDKNLTVAEAIKLAAALHQMNTDGEVTLQNSTGNWYDTYVDYAVENDIVDSRYQKYTRAQMDTNATRAEFVSIFYGAMDNYDVKNTVADNAIPDVKTGDFAADEIYTFYRAGICVGNDRLGTFLPDSPIKRSEVAAILTRMYDSTTRKTISLT